MTIAQLTSVHPRYDIRIYSKECVSLAAAGLGPVTLFVADGRGDDGADHVSIRDVGRPGNGRLGRATLGSIRMLRAVLRARPKVVHFHDPELIPAGLILRLFRFQVIYDVHEDLPRQIMSKDWVPVALRWPVARAMELVEWIAGRAFTAVVPATPTIAARFPPGRTHLVQNFPKSAEFVLPGLTPYQFRRAAFAYIGGVSAIRGAREIVQSLQLLNQQSAATLEFGGAFHPAALEEELKATPGWAYVRHHGWIGRPEVAALLGNSRAGLVLFHPVPNHVDAQPNKMFEYMAAGLPVIASNFPMWREIIDGAACGLLVDPLSSDEIADAMQWILDHPSEAEAMGKRGRNAVTRRFNWESQAKTLTDLYRQILL